jgi:hypothetical protein
MARRPDAIAGCADDAADDVGFVDRRRTADDLDLFVASGSRE